MGATTEPEPYPAFIRDNPVMQGAFSAFIDWIWRQDEAHEAHCHMTGMVRPSDPKNGLERLIDEATGFSQQYVASFVRWAIDTQWGVEGRDDQDDAA